MLAAWPSRCFSSAPPAAATLTRQRPCSWVELVHRLAEETRAAAMAAPGANSSGRCVSRPPSLTRGPKVPAECDCRLLALSDLLHRPLVWPGGSGSTLGEYRLLIEVIDRNGGSVLTRSLQPFEGMFASVAQTGRLSAGEKLDPHRLPGRQSAPALPGVAQRSAIGAAVRRMGRRLRLPRRCACSLCTITTTGHGASVLKFTWRMPAVTVPDQILDYIHAGDSRSCDVMRLQCIESVLYIGFEPVGGTALVEPHSWKPSRLQTRGRSALRPPSAGPIVPSPSFRSPTKP